MSAHTHQILSTDPQASSQKTKTLLPDWLSTLCQPSRMLWFGPLLGFLISVPSIFSGYMADDHLLQQHTLKESIYNKRHSWDYFNFTSKDAETTQYRERGVLPWWTPDTFRIRIFRPISSLLHALLFKFFADAPWIMHVGLAFLYAILIFLCAKLLMQFSSSTVALGIGILLFTINDTHAYTVGWISGYNTLLTCIFGLFSLLMHRHWRYYKSIKGLLLSIVAYILALLSSEGGLALMGYLFAYALFIETGSLRKKVWSIIPGLIITISYLLFYGMHHFGVKGSGVYLSPFDDLLGSTIIILKNSVFLIFSQILSLPPLTMLLGGSGVGNITAGIILLVLVILIFIFRRILFSNQMAAFYGTGMVLSVIPLSLAGWMDRQLLWAGFGAAGLLGELFTSTTTTNGTLQRIITKTLMVSNIMVSLLFFIPTLFFFVMIEKPVKMIERNVSTQNTIVLNAPMDLLFLYPPAIRCKKERAWPEYFYTLYTGGDTLTIKRTGERTIRTMTSKGWLATQGEQFFRSMQMPFKEGDIVDLHMMSVAIEKVTPDGRPKTVSFTFKDSLEHFVWMKWEKNGLKKCDLPELGEEMQLIVQMF